MSMSCKPRCGKFIAILLIGLAGFGWLVMLLWNWLVPELFSGARQITYFQAIGLLVLSRILFGKFRGHGHYWHHSRWENMTPEEREKLQLGLNRWCGKKNSDAPASENKAD
jgi:hypothetical protein